VPLAKTEERDLVLARLVEPPRGSGPLAIQERELSHASRELARIDAVLEARGVRSRGIAFVSADAPRDLARLAAEQQVELLVVDGRRPLLGSGAPGGAVGSLLKRANCDVAVLVDQEHVPVIDRQHPVWIVSGQSPHDELALKLGQRIAWGTGADLRVAPDVGEAADSAVRGGLLVVGVPEQWRARGLGRARARFVAGNVPTLFVRSGS
jgi:hypothetical protein